MNNNENSLKEFQGDRFKTNDDGGNGGGIRRTNEAPPQAELLRWAQSSFIVLSLPVAAVDKPNGT